MLNKKIDKALHKLPLLDLFSSKKMLESQVLNKMGAQSLRIRLAEKRYAMRPKFITDDIKDHLETLQRDGIVVIPDFLPAQEFSALETECHNALANVDRSVTRQDGPNTYSNISSKRLHQYPSIRRAFNHPRIEAMFKAAERRDLQLSDIVTLLSCLEQGPDNSTSDPETALHEDTFFNTHKAWLYISDVSLPQAPFVYVKGSHLSSQTDRYKKADAYSQQPGKIKSRRISAAELEELQLEESAFVARKNTFVMANTLGFHRRLRGEAGHKRVALAYSARYNPFF